MQNSTIAIKTLPLDSDKREIVTYPDPTFPFEIWKGDMSHFSGGGLPPHWHREIEFGLVTEGELEYVSQSGRAHLKKGEAVIVKCEAMHYTHSLTPVKSELYTISFLPSLIAGSEDSLLYREYILPFLSLDFQILKIEEKKITGMLEEIRTLPSGSEIKAMSLIYTLWEAALLFLEKMDIPRRKITPDRGEESIKRALSYIYSHYSEKISVADIAKASFMSRNSLFRHFKASFGRTPLDVLVDQRLTAAAALLEKDMSITEVSSASGFASSSYFIKSFRDRFGKTPGEYRREKRSNNGREL